MNIIDWLNSYDPNDGQRKAKTAVATVEYQDLQSGHEFILNQNIHINGLENQLLCPIQSHLNVRIIEVAKFLAESPSVTVHAIQLTDLFDEAHPLTTLLQ